MELKEKNKQIYIDKEALSTLELAKAGLLGNINKLMNKKETLEVEKTGYYKKTIAPLPFILAPYGKRNKEVLLNAKKNDIIDIITDNKHQGHIKVEEIFEIDMKKRVEEIFGFYDPNDINIIKSIKRMGNIAIAGHYEVSTKQIQDIKDKIQKTKKKLAARNITAMLFKAKPFHRAHERLVRISLEKADMLVIFLLKPNSKSRLSYELRYESLKYFVDNYLPKERILIFPFDNTYIFSHNHNLIFESLAVKNFGCTKLVIGENHDGINIFYDANKINTILDKYEKDINIETVIMPEFVYCNNCRTLVSHKTCPHGTHHHIRYSSEALKNLLYEGILPPAVLMRKDISALLLSKIHINRFKNLQMLYNNLLPNTGLLEERSERDFYEELMNLYQTMSLT